MNQIFELLLKQSPALIGFFGEMWQKHNPGVPPPTPAEIVAGFEQVFTDSLSRDAFLKAALQAEIDSKPAAGTASAAELGAPAGSIGE